VLLTDATSRLLRHSFITYEKGQMIKFQDVKRPAYDLYRTETYDPAAKITPGQTNLRPLEDESFFLKETSRSRRWTTSSFKDEASWIRFKERFYHH
jgi:hypothetical protein